MSKIISSIQRIYDVLMSKTDLSIVYAPNIDGEPGNKHEDFCLFVYSLLRRGL